MTARKFSLFANNLWSKSGESDILNVMKFDDRQMRDIRKRARAAKATMACEDIYLTPEEEALFEQMNKDRIPFEQRRKTLDAYIRDNVCRPDDKTE